MTWGELIYIVNDMCKLYSDDTALNENHISFLLSLYRSTILKNTYSSLKRDIPDSNYQTVCLDMECADGGVCGGGAVMRSTDAVPQMMEIGKKSIFPAEGYNFGTINYVSQSRFQFASMNPYLRNALYAMIGPDRHLYVKSSSDRVKYMDRIRVRAVFQDVKAASELSCDGEGGNAGCDIMDSDFPIEEAFAPLLINYVLKDVLGAAYRPSDKHNDATDELDDIAKMIASYANRRYNGQVRGEE